jgi:hypothetical protein
MANRVKGEVPVTLKDGRQLVLVADMEATIHAEGLYGKPAAQIAKDASEGFVGAIRALFWGMLRTNHPDMTPADVGTLLAENMPEIEEAMNQAAEAAAPKPTEDGDNQDPPQKKPAGRGSGRSGAKRG